MKANGAEGREVWATRIGVVLAMTGNAIGLGNFLRFPGVVAQSGGGAFIIPYLFAFVLLGIPLMWVEWSMGRMGGRHGHGTTPGMFALLWRHPIAKYLGAFGLFMPTVILIYYVYIESWTLAYAFFSLTGKYFGLTSRAEMGAFLAGYQGIEPNEHFSGIGTAYFFFVITIALNVYILSRGVRRGIELVAKIAMPILFLFALILLVRVLTLGAPVAEHPEWNVSAGLGFIWNPDFKALGRAEVWLKAAGQMFFTLSLGMAAIQTYASYLRERDDVALSGLATSSANGFAEIVLGGSIAITAAVVFFGGVETKEIAKSIFDLSFQSMPVIVQKIPLGQLFGTLWFFLLFVAGVTSSLAMGQPIMAFLQDELGLTRRRAALLLGGTIFLLCHAVVFFHKYGFMYELDFWTVNVGLFIFALMELLLFGWVFGMEKAWSEIIKGAQIRIPRFFYYVIKFVTPTLILLLLGSWLLTADDKGFTGLDKILLENVDSERLPYVVGARLLIAVIVIALFLLTFVAWRRRGR